MYAALNCIWNTPVDIDKAPLSDSDMLRRLINCRIIIIIIIITE